jgi:hypothetical protein
MKPGDSTTNALGNLLNVVALTLFVEGIVFAPVVLLIAVAGSGPVRVVKYVALVAVGLAPYVIWRKARPTVSRGRGATMLIVLGLIACLGVVLLLTPLMLTTCSGHPVF